MNPDLHLFADAVSAALLRDSTRWLVVWALLAMAGYVALSVAAQLPGAHRKLRAGWLGCGAFGVGAGQWSAALCAVPLLLPQVVQPAPAPGVLALMLACAGAGLCLGAALLRKPFWIVLAAVAQAAVLVGLYGAWLAAHHPGGLIGLPAASLRWPAAAAFAAALVQGGLTAWWSTRRQTSVAATLAAAVVLATAGLLLPAAYLLWLPAGSTSGPQAWGLDIPLTALALLTMSLTLAVLRLERRLVAAHRRLRHQLKEAQERIERKPVSDDLTGLANREGLAELLRRAASESEMDNSRIALLSIGLENFKSVNESYGHAVGDQVLQEVGRRLVDLTGRELARDGRHALARTSGERYALMVRDDCDRRDLARLAGLLLDTLMQPMSVEGRSLVLTASVGIACFPDDGGASVLMANAEAAMQGAKQAGGSSHMFFEARMQEDARERLELLHDLRIAVERNQLELFYQPKIDARSGKVTAAEALLRWHHPTRGVVSPSVFIPIAERYGLIKALGNWVIEDACRQARVWKDRGLSMRVAINLSSFQMRQDDLVERIRGTLERYRIDPARFTCEITESVAMEDTQATQRTFERLGKAGIHLSIDDFGTGYSSLSYLRQLPAAELKIDRSFVLDLGLSDDARTIVDAVIKLAHAIGLKVVAEGVENERQRDVLLELGCDEFQGYMFAHPMSARALLMWAMEDRPAQHAFKPSLFADTNTMDIRAPLTAAGPATRAVVSAAAERIGAS